MPRISAARLGDIRRSSSASGSGASGGPDRSHSGQAQMARRPEAAPVPQSRAPLEPATVVHGRCAVRSETDRPPSTGARGQWTHRQSTSRGGAGIATDQSRLVPLVVLRRQVRQQRGLNGGGTGPQREAQRGQGVVAHLDLGYAACPSAPRAISSSRIARRWTVASRIDLGQVAVRSSYRRSLNQREIPVRRRVAPRNGALPRSRRA